VKLLRRLCQIVSYNLPWKIAALLASTTLWMAINGTEPNADLYVRLHVSSFGLPKRLVIASQQDSTVEVQLRGPRSILRTIDEEDHRVALDLRGAQPGSASVKVVPQMLNLPRRVRVVRINPPRIDLQVERLLRKPVPVRAVLVPSQRNGYTISAVTVTPATVEVSGPSSRVERLQVIETEPVSTLSGNGGVEREVHLVDAGEWLSFSPSTVQLAFSVSEVEGRRTFTGVKVIIRDGLAGTTVNPPAIEATLRGPQGQLLDLRLEDGAAYVDAAGLEPGAHQVTPRVTVPEGFHLDGVSPASLHLTVPKDAQLDSARKKSREGAE